MAREKVAVILMNLGGPSKIEGVKPFLFRLFFDKRIINLPFVLRWFVAKMISSLRNKKAIEIYKKIGGKSPILENTEKQRKKLSQLLKGQNKDFKVFIAMRHSKPFAKDTLLEVKKYDPNEIILLPLYPHFSSTTTLSSFEEFEQEKHKIPSLKHAKIKKVCCYYNDVDFVNSQIKLIKECFVKNKISKKDFRILFSAHSLPCSVIERGDPYQWQVEQNVELIMKDKFLKDIDYSVCYQSKVGYNKWLSPSTEEEIQKAAGDKVGVVIVPISFVSEHSETLVELDMDYKNLAKKHGTKGFFRVKTQGSDDIFVESLKIMCLKSSISKKEYSKDKLCSEKFCFCVNK